MELPIVEYPQGTTFYRGNKERRSCNKREAPAFFTKDQATALEYARGPYSCLYTYNNRIAINILKLDSYTEYTTRFPLIEYLSTLRTSYASLLINLLHIFFGMTNNIKKVIHSLTELILALKYINTGDGDFQSSLLEFNIEERHHDYLTHKSAEYKKVITTLLLDNYNYELKGRPPVPIEEANIQKLIELRNQLKKTYPIHSDPEELTDVERMVDNSHGSYIPTGDDDDSQDVSKDLLLPSRISIRQFDKLIATLIPLVFHDMNINGFEYTRPDEYIRYSHIPIYANYVDRGMNVPSEVCIYNSNAVLLRVLGSHGGGSLKDVYYTKYKKYKAKCRRLDKTQNT